MAGLGTRRGPLRENRIRPASPWVSTCCAAGRRRRSPRRHRGARPQRLRRRLDRRLDQAPDPANAARGAHFRCGSRPVTRSDGGTGPTPRQGTVRSTWTTGHDHQRTSARDGRAARAALLGPGDVRATARSSPRSNNWTRGKPDVAIVGAPFDVGTTNRPGARFGPRAIRATAYEPGTYHMDLGLEIFDWLEVVDFGDAYCPHGQTEVSHNNIRERVPPSRPAASCPSSSVATTRSPGRRRPRWPTCTATATSASSTSTPTPTPPTSSTATWPATARRCVD